MVFSVAQGLLPREPEEVYACELQKDEAGLHEAECGEEGEDDLVPGYQHDQRDQPV